MKIKKEVKIGLFAIIVIVVAWWGIKWLKGSNLLSRENTYYAFYEDVAGLQVSSRVWIRGVEVGNVSQIELSGDIVKVSISVKRKYADLITENSTAVIGESGLMGGQQITIVRNAATEPLADGGELLSQVDTGLMGMLEKRAGALIESLDATLENLNNILGDNRGTIHGLLANLENATSLLDGMLSSQRTNIEGAVRDFKNFTGTLAASSSRIESMIDNLDTFTGELGQSNIVEQLQSTVESLNGIIAAVSEAEGSAGKLIYDDELYESLDAASANLAALLADLKENPMRYVHFSLFGSSEQKAARKQARIDRREARRAAKNGTAPEQCPN